MQILIVKLSSLGDVVHTLPAVQDIRRALPQAQIDWVVERGFAPLVQRGAGVRRVIPGEIRKWRRALLASATRAQWAAFRADLQLQAYDAVIDLQGLTKSGIVSRVARLAPGGKRYALGNQTDGAGYEAPTRWLADVAIRLEPHVHAVVRSRELCARALGYALPQPLQYGLIARPAEEAGAVAFIHGTSRADKCWPLASWIALGRQLAQTGARIVLPHGSDAEEADSRSIAAGIGDAAQVWPRMPLDALTDRLAGCAGAIGVDSGLSHIAVALDLPHVQIYNFDTGWRTGPLEHARQRSVYARPTPSVEEVGRAWQAVTIER